MYVHTQTDVQILRYKYILQCHGKQNANRLEEK